MLATTVWSASSVSADTLYLKDGTAREGHISYYDPELTCQTVSEEVEGLEACEENLKIERVEAPESPLVTRVFVDREYRLAISGPSGWTVLTPNIAFHRSLTSWHTGQLVRFYKHPYQGYVEHSDRYDSIPGFLNPALSVVVESPTTWKSASEYGRDRLRLLERAGVVSNIQLIGAPSTVSIHGNEWTRIISELDNQGMRVRSADYYLLKHGSIYWVSAIDKAEHFERDWPMFQQAIESCIVD